MSVEMDSGLVDRFKAAIERCLGLHFEADKSAYLREVLHSRADAGRLTPEAYVDRLENYSVPSELGALAQEITTGETYFFRNIDQFHAFRDVALPDRLRAGAAMRILSAGCASGEEAYSLAILAQDAVPGGVSVVGVDVNPAMIKKAVRAGYTAWALRETPPEVRDQWFRVDNREFKLHESIRRMVTFEEQNLADNDAAIWRPEWFDIVFCRNVVMYFTPDGGRRLMARIAGALRPGGYLFLGSAESLRGISQDFVLRHTHDTFYYQRVDRIHRSGSRSFVKPVELQEAARAFPPVVTDADTWVEMIRRSADRIQALADASDPGPADPPASGTMPRKVAKDTPVADAPALRWDLTPPLELLREERFAEALTAMRYLPPEAMDDCDVMLLHAVLLTHNNQLEAANSICRRLIAADDPNAGAYFVLALCCEGSGDSQGAVEHDRTAVYLDGAFAMPHLHLGLLLRRAGDRDAACREFRQAIDLLRREDASRLILFGGGFSRDALSAMCRTEFLACGGQP